MKFSTNKGKFEQVIASMQPFLEKKDLSAITSHIYIEITNDILILKSTDYEMGLLSHIDEIENYEEGKATVNGSNLLNIIRRLKNENINFEVIDNNLHIKQNKTSFKLPMYDANEYPDFPNMETLHKIDVNIINVINSIKNITPAIDNNNPKFELNGALIDIKEDKINFVATDTRRLAISKIENINNKSNQIIVPKKAIIEIQKLFFDDCEIKYDDVNLVVQNKNYMFFTKLINGKFPDYARILPNNFKVTVKVSRNLFIDAIKLITSLKPNIKITFSQSNIVLESLDEDSEAKTQIEENLDINESFQFAVNSKYLLDFLSTSNSEKFEIGFNETRLPFALRDNNFTTIIMPVIL
ncbi:MAG: DNA polymerase III subunit beta [Arcobacteraceae bacterium]|jgi:DNA polymerase-3 subunit beta|nr:DNA polymerase III subunit beta [Arcobacteraceae bacterium]